MNNYVNSIDLRMDAVVPAQYPLFCDLMLTNQTRREKKVGIWIQSKTNKKTRKISCNNNNIVTME